MCVSLLLLLGACRPDEHAPEVGLSPELSAEGRLGERFFRDGRFAYRYREQAGGDLNRVLPDGDPVLAAVWTPDGEIEGPYAWSTVACATCHLSDELDAGSVARRPHLNDFESTPRQTDRGDGVDRLSRNMPSLVGALRSRSAPYFLHSDGEFPTTESVVGAGLAGRIFGWTFAAAAAARSHVASVLRADDGSYPSAARTEGHSYGTLLAGVDTDVPDALRVQPEGRIDVDEADDDALFDTVVAYLARYLGELFLTDGSGAFTGAPYDVFLDKNDLPQGPVGEESDLDYARRLRDAVAALTDPAFVDEGIRPGHDVPFVFGADELAGLRIFLAEPTTIPPTGVEVALGGLGSCVACHPPPQFTDSLFHTTATAQATFERVHGPQAFNYLVIPDLETRNAAPSRWLPANAALPDGEEPFRRLASAEDSRAADLGAWNFVASPAAPECDEGLRRAISAAAGRDDLTDAELLDRAIGAFKTPPLRALGVSGPYFHDGTLDSLDQIVRFYQGWAGDARAGLVRNPDPRLLGIVLEEADVDPLVRFLFALDQDWP